MSKTSTTPTRAAKKDIADYENNPFFVATNGLDLLFKKALSVGILTAIIAAISALTSAVRPDTPTTPPEGQAAQVDGGPSLEPFVNVSPELIVTIAAVVLIVLLVLTFISIVIRGALDYTSARLARGETVTLSEAFRAVLGNFWGYTWVVVIASVKTFLWTLLFIIPGIIMSIRYSLAGVAYFDKKLKGDAAVQDSSQLVKGAWLTTFASQTLINIITLGVIQPVTTPGTNAVLYRQLDKVGKTKPKAHWLSWLTLVLLFLFLAFILSIALFAVWAAANYSQA